LGMYLRLIHSLGALLQRMGNRLCYYKRASAVWIDVGAHLGETTFGFARNNPALTVYAFEPNLKLATQRIGRLPNYFIIPMAVAENDGCADFYINANDAASSILPFDKEGLRRWIGVAELRIESKIVVPTIRLETFMTIIGIAKVDYLKIDAQGADFAVIKSAGNRIRDINKIKLEAQVTPVQLYSGAGTKDEIIKYLEEAGFVFSLSEKQTKGQEENLTFVRVK